MSTKLYHGYRIVGKPATDLPSLMSHLTRFGAEIREKTLWLVSSHLAKTAAEVIDAHALGSESPLRNSKGGSPLSQAREDLRTRARAIVTDHRRDPEIDFEFKVTLIPSNKRMLALLYCEQESFVKTWEANDWVEPFPYWNNTDGPKKLTRRQWTERGKIWDTALGKSGVPSHVGITFEASEFYLPSPEVSQILLQLPTFESRVEHWAYETLLHERVKEEIGERKKAGGNEIFGIVTGAERWLKTDSGLSAIEQQQKVVAFKLKRDLLKDDLLEPMAKVS